MGLEQTFLLSASDDLTGAPIVAGEKLYQVKTEIGHATLDEKGTFPDWTQDHYSVMYYSEETAKRVYPILNPAIEIAPPAVAPAVAEPVVAPAVEAAPQIAPENAS